jgi:hypothetical protein
MTGRLTSQHYRTLAEGLLEKALASGEPQKKEYIDEAIRCLRYARARDQQPERSEPQESENQADVQDQYRRADGAVRGIAPPCTQDSSESWGVVAKHRMCTNGLQQTLRTKR